MPPYRSRRTSSCIAALVAAGALAGCVAGSGRGADDGALAKTGESGTLVGNDQDAHGCIASAGYEWCEAKQKCIRNWEEGCPTLGSDVDVHGCIATAGFTWCEGRQKCVRTWEEPCLRILTEQTRYRSSSKRS